MGRVINISDRFRHEPVFLHIANNVDVHVKNDVGTGLKIAELSAKLDDIERSEESDGNDSVQILREMYGVIFSKEDQKKIEALNFTFAEWAGLIGIATQAAMNEDYRGPVEDDGNAEGDAAPF